MVTLETIKFANATLPAVLPQGYVAVFLGATSGIGEATLKQLALATREKFPRIYIIGRNRQAATSLLAELRQSNISATFEFIERDVSLIREVNEAMREVTIREIKVDLLFMSVGFISFVGRQETSEGLEPSMTTRYYSRARAIDFLTSLLCKSENAHVVSILSAGQEGSVDIGDLDLARPGNYSITKARIHTTTMLTLFMEEYARKFSKISFVHNFPGLVSTPVLARGSSGIIGFLLRWCLVPVIRTFFSISAEDAGARSLFYATNARYTVQNDAQVSAVPEGVAKAERTAGGVFLVDNKSENIDNEKALRELRVAVAEKVIEHTKEVFGRISG